MDSTLNKRPAEIAHIIVPDPLNKERLPRDFLLVDNQRGTFRLLREAGSAAEPACKDYFTLDAASLHYAEDYVELYQAFGEDTGWAPYWGNRLYRSGAVTRRTVVISAILGKGIFADWFVEELRGTMIFAAHLYESLAIAGSVRLFSALRGAEEVPLAGESIFRTAGLLRPKDIEHVTIIPRRDRIVMPIAELRSDPNDVAKYFGQLLRLHYHKQSARA